VSHREISLQTTRLRLREIDAKDWPAVLRYQQHPEYLRFYPWEQRSSTDVQKFLKMFIDWKYEKPRARFQFAITLNSSTELIGLCGVRKKNADAAEAEIGYELAHNYWGQGYATEAAHRVLAFAFDDLDLHRVWATCVPENTASTRVMEKLGMTREGRLRQNRWMKGRWWDTLIYGILVQEWQTGQPTNQ
jgi:RimJ/RimL family protein N-acetyltransferase